jgi:FAD synthetase
MDMTRRLPGCLLQRRQDSLPLDAQHLEPGMTLSAGIVVVGDEILSGKVQDSNSAYLARKLHAIGWQVKRVSQTCCDCCMP